MGILSYLTLIPNLIYKYLFMNTVFIILFKCFLKESLNPDSNHFYAHIITGVALNFPLK